MLSNYMEHVVKHMLPDILSKYENICKCDKCIDDIEALALNNLKPLYSVTEKGAMFIKVNELAFQFRTDVINEIIQAIEIVSKNPNHLVKQSLNTDTDKKEGI